MQSTCGLSLQAGGLPGDELGAMRFTDLPIRAFRRLWIVVGRYPLCKLELFCSSKVRTGRAAVSEDDRQTPGTLDFARE